MLSSSPISRDLRPLWSRARTRGPSLHSAFRSFIGTMAPSESRGERSCLTGWDWLDPLTTGLPRCAVIYIGVPSPPTPVDSSTPCRWLGCFELSRLPRNRNGSTSTTVFRGYCSEFTNVRPVDLQPGSTGPLSGRLRAAGYPSARFHSYRGAPSIPRAGLSPAR